MAAPRQGLGYRSVAPALSAKAQHEGDHDRLGGIGLDARRIVGHEPQTDGHLAHALASAGLGGEGRPRAGPNDRPLIGGERVHERPHELGLRTAARAHTVGRRDAPAFALNHALHGRGDDDVAREPIALRHDEHAGRSSAEIIERRKQSRALVELGATAHASVGVPGGHLDVLPCCPRLDGGALGFGA